jgi:hypothetical protein
MSCSVTKYPLVFEKKSTPVGELKEGRAILLMTIGGLE